MSFQNPFLVVMAILITALAVFGYVRLQKRRTAAMAGYGLTTTAPARRHLPYIMFLVAMPLMLLGLAQPQAVLNVPRIAGTAILVFDVSNSMAADDVQPNRLGAAQAAATSFVQAQPDTVDIGVVVFGQGALMTQAPSANHDEALAAIKRLTPSGGTSLGQAILASLSTITGKPVVLPEEGAPPPDLGYWPSATIVMFSDGEETGGPDVEAAALLAADAGVRIETVGIGTAQGATVEVDGFQVATALNDQMLAGIAEITGGTYHSAQDTGSLNDVSSAIDLRVTFKEEPVELTGILAALSILLLTIGGLMMIRMHGRIV